MKKIALLSFLIAGPGLLQADIIYTDFATLPTTPFDPSNGTFVTNGGTDYSTAFQFAVSSANSYVVTEIDFAAYLKSGDNSITATIYQDNGGTPGTAIYTTGPILNELGSTGNATELEIPVAGGPVLNAGGTYWLSLDGDTSSSITWNDNGNYTGGNEATYVSNAWSVESSRVLGAFELDGTVASPEPMTALLLVPGLAGLFIRRRFQSSK